MKSLLVLAGVLSIAISQSAFAVEKPITFDQLDADGNGYISKEEAAERADLNAKWATADKNADGKVDISEFSAFEVRMVPADDMESPEIGAAPHPDK